MRTEKEMMDLIRNVARKDERVRAVGMNGSRTNPNVPKDLFQDFDIVYLVTDMDFFIRDPSWIDVFGECIIMQTPEDMSMFPPELDGNFSYLMLFADGNRMDLTLCPIEKGENWNGGDKLAKILLDKDNALPVLPRPTDEDYWVQKPTPAFFSDCCNEFWWVSTYVAKGLWRKEFLFAQEHLDGMVRPMLLKMLEWQAGTQTDFSVSIGKSGKYLQKYLPDQSWQQLLVTYEKGSYEDTWRALFSMGDLFRHSAKYVAENLNFQYPDEEDRRVSAYLKHVKNLPSNATKIY